ncbi:hypothetical protein FE257_003643 [Aspergillus nanangensis]|uniref:NAD-dependent epimerase/dehydratase domain-containing protein n=1 Tax=Aspergillus nanangensis TaxID=2582783 RepID=A0AAD4CTU6_ASPNN|nr:hypothetical protein FE257_003643 [Aspergillus nanangensis]
MTVSDLVFVTGASGFIGSQVTLSLLTAGYKVRLSLRREEQIAELRAIFSKYVDQLEFVIIPDITVTGVFDKALNSVQYVIHIASPLPQPGDLLTPAVRGTESILEEASKWPCVKKVVICASIASFFPVSGAVNGTIYKETFDVGFDETPEEIAQLDHFSQYIASKNASYKATIDFVRNQKPSFDVVTLHPAFTFGRSLIQKRADEQLDSTNTMLFNAIMYEQWCFGAFPLRQFLGVHLDDVAAAHLKVLDGSIQGFQQYLLSAPRRSVEDVVSFITTQYPNLPFKLKPGDTKFFMADASKAEKELGMHFKPMEDQVKDVMDQQLELLN